MSSSDSSQSAGGPPSSSSRPLPVRPPNPPSSSHLMTRTAFASFTSPSLSSAASEPTPQPSSNKRHRFSVERIYEFEAPQFYDFTKQSDPERGHLDEHWFDSRKRTPSSPDFHFTSSTAFRPKSASGKIYHKGNFSGSNGGLSFMNTPIGRGQAFTIPSSVGADIRSSVSFKPRAALKKSASTENVANSILMNSDSSDPPSTIIRSAQKRFIEFGSDERKIISGFLSTPLLVIKTPGGVRPRASSSKKDQLPRSPLQKVTTRKSNLGLFPSEGSSLLVRETSSIEESLSLKGNETNFIAETSVISSTDCSVPNTSILSISHVNASHTSANPLTLKSSSSSSVASIKEHESFQASVKARILEERERIEVNAAAQAKKLQKIKSGPTNLPVKSTKPLTIPKGFALKSDERAQLKKSHSGNLGLKVAKPPSIAAHKFVPTIPRSPLFASKIRAEAKSNAKLIQSRSSKAATSATITTTAASSDPSNNNNENVISNSNATTNALRRKLEYRPPITKTLTIPQSPKLSSIHRNRHKINK